MKKLDETKYLDLKNDNNYEKLKTAGEIIKNGGLVLFPTETVYGLGANGLDEVATKNIFLAKGRNQDNPLILHICDMDMLDTIVTDITDIERKLMEAFWPGPFTIVLKRKEIVPNVTTAGLDTVGVRMPEGEIARKLIYYANTPIAAPSANISGRPSGTNVEDIIEELYDKVDYIIDGGNCNVGLESTVVRVIDGVPTILRPGKITPMQIKEVAGTVKIDKYVLNKIEDNNKVLSPGMKYRHYAPKATCIMIYSEDNNKLTQEVIKYIKENKNPVVISCNENIKIYEKYVKPENIIDIGSKNNLEEIAKNVFKTLRMVDSYNPDIVIIEGVKEEEIGLAIMNRLIRACEYNYIKI